MIFEKLPVIAKRFFDELTNSDKALTSSLFASWYFGTKTLKFGCKWFVDEDVENDDNLELFRFWNAKAFNDDGDTIFVENIFHGFNLI